MEHLCNDIVQGLVLNEGLLEALGSTMRAPANEPIGCVQIEPWKREEGQPDVPRFFLWALSMGP